MESNLSNEKIVESLTNDLKELAVKNQQTESDEEWPQQTSSNSEILRDNETRESNCNLNSNCVEESAIESNEASVTEEDSSESEFIDEHCLENRDASLSEEEKEIFLKEALAHKMEGNELFKTNDYYKSIISYTNALRICPIVYNKDRSVMFANRAASKHKLDRKESAIQDCSKALTLNTSYLKAYLRRATLYEEQDKLDEALEDYKKILEFDPRNEKAISASQRLPPLINERNEKLKTEMLDKLKDLGNTVLRPFGLSTNNFKMTKDPNSGGYSINFVPNS